MSDNTKVDLDVIGGGKIFDCEYTGKIMSTLFEDVNLRDIKLVAGIDQQK